MSGARPKRGEYRPIYAAMIDHPKYQALTPAARLALLTLKLHLGPLGIGPVYPGALAEQTGLSDLEVGEALAELEGAAWIAREHRLVWLIDGLEHEPNFRLTSDSVRTFVKSELGALPGLSIVALFCAHYGVENPHGDTPNGTPSRTPGGTPSGTPTDEVPQETPNPKPAKKKAASGGDPLGDPLGDPVGDTKTKTKRKTTTNTTHTATPSGVENSIWLEAKRLAHEGLGLGRLSYREQQRNRSIIEAWRYREGRNGADVVAAIRGAIAIRDDAADDTLEADTAYSLARLYNTKCLVAYAGDGGKSMRPLWTVCLDRGYAMEDDARPRSQRTKTGPTSIADAFATLGLDEVHA